MKKQLFSASLLIAILGFTFFAPAFAKAPTVITEEFNAAFEASCGEFTASFNEDWKTSTTTFYNKDGNIDRFTFHARIKGTLIKLETGTVLREQASFNITGEPPVDDISDTVRGVIWHFTAPGKGTVIINAGKVVFDENGNVVSFSGVARPPYYDLEQFICDGLRDI